MLNSELVLLLVALSEGDFFRLANSIEFGVQGLIIIITTARSHFKFPSLSQDKLNFVRLGATKRFLVTTGALLHLMVL